MEKIKLLNNEDKELEIISINQNSKLLIIEFPELINLSELDTSSIDLYTANGVKCTLKPIVGYDTIYKIEGNTVILSNDGSIYVKPTIPDPDEEVPTEPYEPYEPTEEELALQLENNKKAKIAESKTQLDTFLENNPYLFTDGKCYSVTREKQNLLNNAISVYQMKLQIGETNVEIKWNATGEECVIKSIEEVMSLALGIANYVEPLVAKQQAFEVQINSFTTQSELDNLVIAYETAI